MIWISFSSPGCANLISIKKGIDMHRIDRLLMKLDTITRLNRGEIDLINPRLSITSTLNNLIRTLLDDWPLAVSEREISSLVSVIVDYFQSEGEVNLTRRHIEWLIERRYEALVPILVIRHLMRDEMLMVHVSYNSKREWSEFLLRYRGILRRVDEALLEKSFEMA